MKILDFNLEGNHFIIEADVSPRQEADDDMECQCLQYDFENAQVYKETDGVFSRFQITAVAWEGYQLTAAHALNDVIGRISRNETGKLTVHYICPELQEFFGELKKYPAINGERMVPYFSHSVVDFLAPEIKMYGQALLDIPCYKILMGCDGKNLQETTDLYNLTDAEQELLESKRRGHALFLVGSKRLHVNFEIPAYKFAYMGKAGGR